LAVKQYNHSLQKHEQIKDLHVNITELSNKTTQLEKDLAVVRDYDSPDVLKEYADEYDANLDNWDFLTGYDFETIRKLSIKSFRAPLKEPAYGSDQVTHDVRFFLVDPEGNIVKGYKGIEKETIDTLLDDIITLDEKGLL